MDNYITNGKSCKTIANEIGVSRSTIRNKLIEYRIPRRTISESLEGVPKTDIQRLKMSQSRTKYWDRITPEEKSEHSLNISKGKFKHGMAQGRKRVYVAGRGQVHDYRIEAERILGRPLQKGEVVHHIDGNPLNCSPDNLQIMTQSEHARIHYKSRKRDASGHLI